MSLDLRLYVITTTLPQLGRDHLAIAEAAVRGGATVLQFRDKTMPDADFTAMASRVLQVVRRGGVPLIVNDRADVAMGIGAAGVHVGQQDADAREVRRSLPSGMVLGVSTTTRDESLAAADAGADYLGVGPVFPTGSKADAARPLGLDELARICRSVSVPVVAIGGINRENLKDVIEAGAAGAAVIAAVAETRDMAVAISELRSVWDYCGARRVTGHT